MREAREEMLRSLNESNLEKMRKAAKGAKQTLKMKDGSIGMDSFTASAIMQIYDKVNDKNRKTMENLLKDGKKADIVKLMKFAMSKVNAEYVPEEFEEEFELDEARKSQGMFIVLEKGSKNKVIGQFKEKDKAMEMMKKSAGSKVIQIGKFATVDDKPVDIKVGDNLSDTRVKLSTKIKEEVEEGAAADARRAMRGDPDMRQRAFSKDDSATDDERKAASKNIMMQMRKAVSLRSFDVEFADGKKVKIPQRVAQAVLQKYNSFRKPADKEKYQAKVGKSYKDMLAALKEGFASDAQRRAAFAQGYKAKGKKDKKESTLERMNKKIQEKKNG